MSTKVKTGQDNKITLFIIGVIMTLYLLLSAIPGDSISKIAAVCMLILLIGAFLTGKLKELPKAVVTPVVIGTAVYFIIYVISLFYAGTGQFALAVFSYYLGGVSLFFLTIYLVNNNTANARRLLFLAALAIGIGGLFSIDAASVRGLTAILQSLLSPLLESAKIQLGGFEAGTRMTSIINNPNVFGSLAAMGTLSSAYLLLSSASGREKHFSIGLLVVNSVSFLYCFSLGSLISMFFAVVGFIIFVGKEERSRVVYVILVTILSSFLSVFAGFSGMGKSGAIAFLPFLSLLIFGFVLAFLIRFTDRFSAGAANLGGKKILLILLIVIILLSGGIGAALTISDSYTFDTAGTLKRAVTLEPGDYRLSVKSDNLSSDATVLIESQSYDQASTHTSSTLYQGKFDPEAITFSVPNDSNICFISISAPAGAVVNTITVLDSDGKTIKSINPDYLLLPTFMANRLQGIFVNENAAQRFVFFKDGMKIAAMSPVIGHGPGAFESNVLAVQDYYYETRSPHNHYIQTLDEVGIIGLIAFLSIFVFSAAALHRKVRSAENRVLFGSLAAMLIMMIIHTALEVTFIFGIYDMIAFMVFALISSCYGQKESVIQSKKSGPMAVSRIAVNTAFGLSILILALYIGQFAAVQTANKASTSGNTEKFLDTLAVCTTLDFTNDVSYKTSYIMAYTTNLSDSYYKKSQIYAKDLEKHNSFGTLTNLVNYYLKVGQDEKAYQTLNNRQKLMRFDAEGWNQTFDFYRQNMDTASKSGSQEKVDLIKKYASAAYKQLEAYLETSPLDIQLSEENREFVEDIAR